MKKKLIIHIGTHKTGTTFLQHSFSQGSQVLREYGLLYPEGGRKYNAHHLLAWTLRPDSKPGSELFELDGWNAFLEEAKGFSGEAILISSEDFEWLMDISLLGQLNEHFDVKVLFYLRAADAYVESYYNQIVKDFQTKEERTLTNYVCEETLFFLDAHLILKRWEAVFGREAVILRLFDRSKFVNGSLVDDVFDAIGLNKRIELEPPRIDYIHKTSLPPDSLEYLRQMNRFLEYGDGHHNFVVELVQLSLENKEKLQTTRAGLLSLKTKQNIMRRFGYSYLNACNDFMGVNQNPFPPELAKPHANYDERLPVGSAELFARVAALARMIKG